MLKQVNLNADREKHMNWSMLRWRLMQM